MATLDGRGSHILLLIIHCLCNRRKNHDVSESSIEINDGGNLMIEQKDNKLGAESNQMDNGEILVLTVF
jgi:hypothetical protein